MTEAERNLLLTVTGLVSGSLVPLLARCDPENMVTDQRHNRASCMPAIAMLNCIDSLVEKIDAESGPLRITVERTQAAKDLGIPLPSYQTEGAAALDLYAAEDVELRYGNAIWVRSGVMLQLPPGWCCFIKRRSGLHAEGIAVHEGLVDQDFTKPICVGLEMTHAGSLKHHGLFKLEAGKRIAQCLFLPIRRVELVEGTVAQTERGGFGSTGL